MAWFTGFDVFYMGLIFCMVLVTTFVTIRKMKGAIDREFYGIIALAPLFIIFSFVIGKLLAGNNIKFLIPLVAFGAVFAYMNLRPLQVKKYEKYNKTIGKYAGVFMAIMLAFWMSGCSPAPEPPKQDEQKMNIEERIQKSEAEKPELKKGAGPGAIR